MELRFNSRRTIQSVPRRLLFIRIQLQHRLTTHSVTTNGNVFSFHAQVTRKLPCQFPPCTTCDAKLLCPPTSSYPPVYHHVHVLGITRLQPVPCFTFPSTPSASFFFRPHVFLHRPVFQLWSHVCRMRACPIGVKVLLQRSSTSLRSTRCFQCALISSGSTYPERVQISLSTVTFLFLLCSGRGPTVTRRHHQC